MQSILLIHVKTLHKWVKLSGSLWVVQFGFNYSWTVGPNAHVPKTLSPTNSLSTKSHFFEGWYAHGPWVSKLMPVMFYELAAELMETWLVNWFFVGCAGSRTGLFGVLLGTCPSNWRQPDRAILALRGGHNTRVCLLPFNGVAVVDDWKNKFSQSRTIAHSWLCFQCLSFVEASLMPCCAQNNSHFFKSHCTFMCISLFTINSGVILKIDLNTFSWLFKRKS